jgi:tRNA U34 2-thiouridine synthase MnmA/TrmU
MVNSIKAVALLSGGLDSMLAARIVQAQGVDVLGVHFSTGFCSVQRRRRVARPTETHSPKLRNEALQSAATIHVPIEIVDVSDRYLPVVINPKHGYGAHMNPCQDCRAFMLSRAKEYMLEKQAHFVVTGEVMGQRPNSQKKHMLRQTARESGLEGLILRPLSAKLLHPSIPEQNGWVDREALYGISGRGRKEQIQLAAQFGITEFAQPAGGCCMLVEESFSRRLRDFLDHNPPEALNQAEIALLSVGRHFRLPDGTKVVAGRHEGENNFLDRVRRPEHWHFESSDHKSPVALVSGPLTEQQIKLTAGIVAAYSNRKNQATVEILVDDGQSTRKIPVAPLTHDETWKMNVGAIPTKQTKPKPS